MIFLLSKYSATMRFKAKVIFTIFCLYLNKFKVLLFVKFVEIFLKEFLDKIPAEWNRIP